MYTGKTRQYIQLPCCSRQITVIWLLTTQERDVTSWDRSLMMGPFSYFSFQPVLHDWCNKGHGMWYHICGMVHTKEPLLLIDKSSPCGGSGFPLSLSEWSLTICPTPYNRIINVLSASLNKTFPSFYHPINRWHNPYAIGAGLNFQWIWPYK